MRGMCRWHFHSGDQLCFQNACNESSLTGSLKLSHLCIANALSSGADISIEENFSALKLSRVFQRGSTMLTRSNLSNAFCEKRQYWTVKRYYDSRRKKAYQFLRSHVLGGCQYGQQVYFSHPIPV